MRKLLLLVLLLLVGCSHGQTQIRDTTLLEQIQVDKTTKADVIELLGKPRNVSFSQGKTQNIELWAYTCRKIDARAFLPVIGLFFSNIVTQFKLTLTFDQTTGLLIAKTTYITRP